MSAHDITLSRLDGLERSVLLDLIERNDTSLSNLSCTDAVLELAASKAVDIAHSHWQSLFAGFSAQDGKRMAKEAVSQMPKSDARSLTYGEVDFFSFAIILELAETSAGSLFVDIGHGTGRAVLAAAMLRGHHFRECRGVELLKPLVAASLEAQGRFDALVAAHPRLYGAADGKPRSIVTMLEGDLLAAHAEGSDDQGVADALSPDGAWTEVSVCRKQDCNQYDPIQLG